MQKCSSTLNYSRKGMDRPEDFSNFRISLKFSTNAKNVDRIETSRGKRRADIRFNILIALRRQINRIKVMFRGPYRVHTLKPSASTCDRYRSCYITTHLQNATNLLPLNDYFRELKKEHFAIKMWTQFIETLGIYFLWCVDRIFAMDSRQFTEYCVFSV